MVPTRHTSCRVPYLLRYSQDSDVEDNTRERGNVCERDLERSERYNISGYLSGYTTPCLRRFVVSRSLVPDGCWYAHLNL